MSLRDRSMSFGFAPLNGCAQRKPRQETCHALQELRLPFHTRRLSYSPRCEPSSRARVCKLRILRESACLTSGENTPSPEERFRESGGARHIKEKRK